MTQQKLILNNSCILTKLCLKNIRRFRVTPNWTLGSHCTAAALIRLIPGIPVLWHDVILGLATRIRIFWIRNCFFFSWHGLHPHTFGEFGSESGYFLILHSQTGEEKDKSATSPTTCGQRIRIFRWRNKIISSLLPNNKAAQLCTPLGQSSYNRMLA